MPNSQKVRAKYGYHVAENDFEFKEALEMKQDELKKEKKMARKLRRVEESIAKSTERIASKNSQKKEDEDD